MDNQILIALKRKLEDLTSQGMVDVETQRNALKEELQFYVLNFLYHHPVYSTWTMYGGSALRICHDLNRMSVDLDFEVAHPITEPFLAMLRKDLEAHFLKAYGVGQDLLTMKITNGRGLLLRFLVGTTVGINHASNQVHVKIDLNHFVAPTTVIERRPITRDQLAFVIRTYNMAALMASKIAAIFLRGQRGVGEETYTEKGRDIYDLLWYMSKKVIPDFDYLTAKGVDVRDPRALFDKLTVQLDRVSDANLRQDLTPLFTNRNFIENWLLHWRESYLHLHQAYQIQTVTALQRIAIHREYPTYVYYFEYVYAAQEGGTFQITFALSEYWFEHRDGDLPLPADASVTALIEFTGNRSSALGKIHQYATLFHQKTEAYLEKMHRVVLGDLISTKVIRMTADNLNQKEQILLNRSALLSADLVDLLK